MEELFNKPILDQMYEFRKENFEQYVYDNNNEIKDIKFKINKLFQELMMSIKLTIPNQKEYKKIIKIINEYELHSANEIKFWSLQYFKLGMLEKEKIINEFFKNKIEIEKNDTFLNYKANNFSDWLEEQKRKYTFETKVYKELQRRYNEISEKYPNAIEVFEDLKAIQLNKREMKALIELRKIDIEMGYMEKDLCFKLGMKEVLNF